MSKRELFFPITDRADIRRWFQKLLDYGVNFHPDNDFDEYVELGTGGRRVFTNVEAKRLDRMMNDAFEIAGEGVYTIGLTLIRKHLGRK